LEVEHLQVLILQELLPYFQQLHQQVVEAVVVLTKTQETLGVLVEEAQVDLVQQVVQVTHLL
jgi:hypothetical protein